MSFRTIYISLPLLFANILRVYSSKTSFVAVNIINEAGSLGLTIARLTCNCDNQIALSRRRCNVMMTMLTQLLRPPTKRHAVLPSGRKDYQKLHCRGNWCNETKLPG